MLLNYKLRVNRESFIEDIYFTRPIFSLNGREFSCVVDDDYQISNSTDVLVQINSETTISLRPSVSTFTEQGWATIPTKYPIIDTKVSEGIDDSIVKWYYIMGDNGYIKSGKQEGSGNSIIFEELNNAQGSITDDGYIQLDTVYYVEDGYINYKDVLFKVEMDENGVSPMQNLLGDAIIFIHNASKKNWVRKKRLVFVVNEDKLLPFDRIELGKCESYIIVGGEEYVLNESWDEYPPNTGLQGNYFKRRSCIVSGETINELLEGETKDYDGPYPEIYTNYITIDDIDYEIHTRYIPHDRGEVLLMYIDSEKLTNALTTKYFVAERLISINYDYYVETISGETPFVSIDGYSYDVENVNVIDLDGVKELSLIQTSATSNIYSVINNDGSKLFLASGTTKPNVVTLISETGCTYDVISMQKTVVNDYVYYKEIVEPNDKQITAEGGIPNAMAKETPFTISIKPTYKLHIIEFEEPNLCVCQVEFGEIDYMCKEPNADKIGVHKDIFNNISEYAIKYQQPQFNKNKTDERVLADIMNTDDYVVDAVPNVQLQRLISDLTIQLPMDNLHGTNLQQEIIVKDKFVDEFSRNRINSIVDMEKDMYYPMKITSLNDKDILTDVTDVEFYLHFRTRDEEWNVKEDYLTTYKDSMNLSNEDTTLTDDEIEDPLFDQMSWNIFDRYGKNATTGYDANKIYSDESYAYYQPSDLLSFLDFGDDDVFYQKSKIGKSFLRLSFFDTKNPKTQMLLGTSTIFMDSGELFGKFSDLMSNPIEGIEYRAPTNWKSKTNFVSVTREPLKHHNSSSNTETLCEQDICTFDESQRISSKMVVSNKLATSNSAEGFYNYIFREYSSALHERTIYLKIQFNHAGHGNIIDLIQPMEYKQEENKYYLLDLSDNNIREEFKKGIPLKELYDMMYIPIKVKYDLENKKYCWYLPKTLVWHDENKIKFNLYEIKVKDYEAYQSNN